MRTRLFALLLALLPACGGGDDRKGAAPLGGLLEIGDVEMARERRDPSWRSVVELDTTLLGDSTSVADSLALLERWEDISARSVNGAPMLLPLGADLARGDSLAGPSVLRVQVLLDRALFSPGVIDGRWGVNTEKAVYWFQRREGLRTTARVDSATFARLAERAGTPVQLVRAHRLTPDDVRGPFLPMPEDPYARAELECQCYESRAEKLGERFHVTPALLSQLNPGVNLHAALAGDVLSVPHVRDSLAAGAAPVARIVVSDRGRYVHAVDARGYILFHFPSTLGSRYNPSPTGALVVESVTENPWWHYQPALLDGKNPDDPEAHLPPGPNNAVGLVWMALSEPHYGIHGTQAPHTIGYATSSGCVRLTNWDALFLARRIAAGTPVEFRDPHTVVAEVE
ncbi:MAG TPA: L,D-transpeptidase [Gemmatimonadaceae bacterium]|nr:L,D-transpeptidase [Gemmatimonadaceae bacterium]